MSWSRKFAQASGATLGFITGDVVGAAAGGYLGGKASDFFTKDSMAGPVTPPRTPRKRKRRNSRNKPRKRGNAVRKAMYKRKYKARYKRKYKKRNAKTEFVKMDMMSAQHHDYCQMKGGRCRIGTGHRFKSMGKYYYKEGKQFTKFDIDGLQQVIDLPQMATKNQLIGTTAASRSGSFFSWDTDPFQLNPYNVGAASALYPAFAGGVADDRIALAKCKHKIHFVNMVNHAQQVSILYLTAKMDNNANPSAVWAADTTATNLGQAAAAVDNIIGANTATGGAQVITRWGAEPMTNPHFKRNYRLLKRHDMVLQPGAQCQLEMDFIWNRTFTKQMLTDRPGVFLRDTTILPLMIVRGALVGAATIAGIGGVEVTHGETKIGILTDNEWVFNALPSNRLTTTRAYTPWLVGAEGAGAGPQRDTEMTDTDVRAQTDVM